MLLQFVFSLAVLGTPQAESEFAWADALDKLAPHMAGFKASDDAPAHNTQRLEKLIDQLKLGPRKDPKTNKQVGGLCLGWEEGVFPVAGVSDATYALITWGSTAGVGGGGSVTANIFRKVRGKWDFECVDDNEVFPRHVLLYGRTLIVSGRHDWMSNCGCVAVRSFRCKSGAWRVVATKIARYESWDPPKLRLAANGRGVQPVRVVSRTYPRFLDSSHATACLSYEEEWVFRDGLPKLHWKKLRDTPFNALDRLYDAICRKDLVAIRRRSLDAKVAKAILALHSRAGKGTPSVRFPRSVSDLDGKEIGVANLKVFFHFGLHKGRWVVTRLSSMGENE